MIKITGQSISHKRFVTAKKILFYGLLTCLAFVFIVYVWACWSIGSSVKDISARVTQEYSGDRVESKIAYVQSEKHSLRDSNRAVWALGQIGDSHALPVSKQHSENSISEFLDPGDIC